MLWFVLTTVLAAQPNISDVRLRQAVLETLSGDEYPRDRLIQYGFKYYPVYYDLLQEASTEALVKMRIMNVLAECVGDRSQFLEPARRGMADTDAGVRREAVLLIPHVGGGKYSAAVAVLLSDPDRTVAYAAAKSLTEIGGPSEIVAFDIWLARAVKNPDAVLKQRVTECRRKLVERLAKTSGDNTGLPSKNN